MSNWISVTDGLPDPGKKVLAVFLDQNKNYRRICAHYTPERYSEAHPESDFWEYDEENDIYYDREGWYERIENWGDFTSVFVSEGDVVFWMPLPEAPEISFTVCRYL